MKLDIVVTYRPRYPVRVIHQQVEPVNFETDADLVAISSFGGFADEAYRLAEEFRVLHKRGICVMAARRRASWRWPMASTRSAWTCLS